MLRMLVVDDDPNVCEAMKAGLEDYCGAAVLCGSTGASAIEFLKSQRLDAAIIDVDLPDVSGIELANRAANLNVPILLTAGHPDAVSLCADFSYPYLAKPFLPSILAEEAIHIIRKAAENIAQVRDLSAKLTATAASLAEAIKTARGLIGQSTQIISRVERGRSNFLD